MNPQMHGDSQMRGLWLMLLQRQQQRGKKSADSATPFRWNGAQASALKEMPPSNVSRLHAPVLDKGTARLAYADAAALSPNKESAEKRPSSVHHCPYCGEPELYRRTRSALMRLLGVRRYYDCNYCCRKFLGIFGRLWCI